MRDYMAAKVLSEVNHVSLADEQLQLQATDPGVCPKETSKYWGIILANPATYARLHAAGTVPVLIGTNFDRWLQYFGQEYSLPDLWRPFFVGGPAAVGKLILAELLKSPWAIGLMLGLTVFQLVLYLLALTGAMAAIRGASSESSWMALVVLATIAVLVLVPGQGGHERFRVPVQPMLAILISYGAATRPSLKRRRWSGAATA